VRPRRDAQGFDQRHSEEMLYSAPSGGLVALVRLRRFRRFRSARLNAPPSHDSLADSMLHYDVGSTPGWIVLVRRPPPTCNWRHTGLSAHARDQDQCPQNVRDPPAGSNTGFGQVERLFNARASAVCRVGCAIDDIDAVRTSPSSEK
jgi:hypothetical protein